jgi:Transglutaminase-like superfamily
MWEPLQRYNALSSEARKMFRRAAMLLPLVGVSLRLRGYKKTQQWLQNKLDRRSIAPLQPEYLPVRLEMTCRMVRAAEHYSLLPSSCLDQSLLLWYLLQSEGIGATLCIGVRKELEKFEAHAWVEHQGGALNQAEQQHRHYAAFGAERP